MYFGDCCHCTSYEPLGAYIPNCAIHADSRVSVNAYIHAQKSQKTREFESKSRKTCIKYEVLGKSKYES